MLKKDDEERRGAVAKTGGLHFQRLLQAHIFSGVRLVKYH